MLNGAKVAPMLTEECWKRLEEDGLWRGQRKGERR